MPCSFFLHTLDWQHTHSKYIHELTNAALFKQGWSDRLGSTGANSTKKKGNPKRVIQKNWQRFNQYPREEINQENTNCTEIQD